MNPKQAKFAREYLNLKQTKFVREYLIDHNATQAAIRAGYSKRSAHANGSRMLEHDGIRKAIAEGTEKHLKKAELKAEDVLNEIKRLAFVNIANAYDAKGKLLPIKEMPEDVQLAIHSMDVQELTANGFKTGELKKIKLADKVKSLEMLAKHFKLLTDMSEHKVVAEVSATNKTEITFIVDELEDEY